MATLPPLPAPEHPGTNVLQTIGLGLQRIQKFHLITLWLMGAHANDEVEVDPGVDWATIEIRIGGQIVFGAGPEDVNWQAWDSSRFCDLQARLDEQWRYYNALYAQLAGASPIDAARLNAERSHVQEKLCSSFAEL